MRFSLAATIAMDVSKLPLFVIFKGTPGGNVERSLTSILPDGIIGCVQPEAWMHSRTMTIGYNSVENRTLLSTMVRLAYYWMILSVITVRT